MTSLNGDVCSAKNLKLSEVKPAQDFFMLNDIMWTRVNVRLQTSMVHYKVSPFPWLVIHLF